MTVERIFTKKYGTLNKKKFCNIFEMILKKQKAKKMKTDSTGGNKSEKYKNKYIN